MEIGTIEKIFNFLEEKEDKELPRRWKTFQELYTHPDGIQYRHEGDLDFRDSNITKLPNDLYVDGFLILDRCKSLKELPSKLYVGKSLNVMRTTIKKLPDNLYVEGSLSLDFNREISEFPNNLYVGRNLYINKTSLANKYTDGEIREIVASTGGKIRGSIIRNL
jgi:hypothetical protein